MGTPGDFDLRFGGAGHQVSARLIYAFEVDPLRHISLLEGRDPSALTLKSLPLIEASEDQSQLD